VRDALQSRGALFFADLVKTTGLIRTEVELALAELVAAGLVTADSFAGLRALVTPASRKGRARSSRRPQAIDAAGRWDLVERSLDADTGNAPAPVDADSAAWHIAGTLLNRYGIMFRSLLLRESKRLPPWRELARVYRRMEARGEIRGGRFVTGFSGEQFALPDAVAALRATRRKDQDQHSIVIGSADPLNLSGIITPGMRVPAASGNRLLYRDGVVVAVQASGQFQWFAEPDPEGEWVARNMLLRHGSGVSYLPSATRLS
jgi:ATP-dependent Lhr-like helicase